jgi:hypothetical protein
LEGKSRGNTGRENKVIENKDIERLTAAVTDTKKAVKGAQCVWRSRHGMSNTITTPPD